MYQLKKNHALRLSSGTRTITQHLAQRLLEEEPGFVRDFLGADVALVPIPRSSLSKPGALWPALELAQALHAVGLGATVLPCLVRNKAISKAATSQSGDRPKARTHRESLVVTEALSLPDKITLVDDIITRGAQAMGAAWTLWDARPTVELRAFAAMRTVSDPAGFSALLDPRSGRITLRHEECFRRP